MADTVRSADELLNASTGLFRDNTAGDISAQDLRDFVLSTYRPQAFCQGRLTLTSGTPVTTSDVTTATSVYFTPYNGNLVGLYDGTSWKLHTFTERTLAIGTVVPFQAYDVFLYDNAGTLTLEQLEWQNATVTMTIASPCVVTWTGHGLATGNSITFTTSGALPTGVSADTRYFVTVVDANTFKLSTSLANLGSGTFVNTSGSQSGTHTGHSPTARATALTTQDGVYVKSGATTRRYLGTYVPVTTTQATDTVTQRLLWNHHNRVRRPFLRHDATNSWSYGTTSWRQVRATTTNLVEGVVGWADVVLALLARSMIGGASGYGTCGIGEDSVTAPAASCLPCQLDGTASVSQSCTSSLVYAPAIGYHCWPWLERGGSGTMTWYGNANAQKTGLSGSIEG